jgi:hypothetical protein
MGRPAILDASNKYSANLASLSPLNVWDSQDPERGQGSFKATVADRGPGPVSETTQSGPLRPPGRNKRRGRTQPCPSPAAPH